MRITVCRTTVEQKQGSLLVFRSKERVDPLDSGKERIFCHSWLLIKLISQILIFAYFFFNKKARATDMLNDRQ